ncbi:MAG: hypothetical protein COU68_03245 [Candidatus Pacebacteria bacterium CG10_big_fil_rev_8_21_14_0_10_45_6]|nr:MAG: hypothetical protein COU68_03245 [Candidatus Pacebacteria bacterium CG10_big_fil_rev_8_21_14_0_10_45_6]
MQVKLLRKIRSQKKLLIGLAILVLALIGFLFTRANKAEVKKTFVSPVRQEIAETLEISGTVDALQKARLRFIAGGKVTYLSAQEGDTIKKWQTIASIDKAALQKTLQKDLNLYMQERWDWESRIDDTKYRWLDDAEQLAKDKAQWDLENKVIDVEVQDITLQNTNLTAPFAGILTHSPITSTGTQLLGSDYFELVDPTTLVFVGRVDEADVAKISEGLVAKIRLDAFEGETFTTSVEFVSFASSETADGTVYSVRFPLQAVSDAVRFRLGMNGDATIELAKSENALTLPINATRIRNDKTYVDVLTTNNQTEEREITTDKQTDYLVEILSGLSENDQVLLPE